MEHAQRGGRHALDLRPTSGSLNPYFNGTCSKSSMKTLFYLRITTVLILILMEHAQRDKCIYSCRFCHRFVLILILMEHAQREY